jgi:hypothetical protein
MKLGSGHAGDAVLGPSNLVASGGNFGDGVKRRVERACERAMARRMKILREDDVRVTVAVYEGINARELPSGTSSFSPGNDTPSTPPVIESFWIGVEFCFTQSVLSNKNLIYLINYQ